MAEGNAAIHAARSLLALFFLWKWMIDFEPVMDALVRVAAERLFAIDFKKTRVFTHAAPLRWPPPGATD
jgi:hypothetical protein